MDGVYRVIASGATPQELAEHLVQVEEGCLGFRDTDPKMLIPLARKLLRINLKQEGSDGAA